MINKCLKTVFFLGAFLVAGVWLYSPVSILETQEASAFACASQSVGGSVNWTDTSQWTSCNGSYPGSVGNGNSDTVVIQSGSMNMTLNAAFITIASLTFNLISSSTSLILNGNTLNVNGAVTINAPTSIMDTATVELAVGTGTLSATGLTTIKGSSSTSGQIGKLSVSSGTFTAGGGITFTSDVATYAQLTTTGAATINLTGTIATGGTLSINSGTTLVSTGTSSITGAYTFGNLTVSSGTLSLSAVAVTFAGATSISGTLNSATGSTGTKTFTGAVTVNSGGTFDMSGQNPVVSFGGGLTQSSSNLANIGSGSNIFIGDFAGAGTGGITFGGALSIPSGGTNNAYTGGAITVTGTITLTGSLAQGLGGSILNLESTTPFAGLGNFCAVNTGNTVNYTGVSATIKDPSCGAAHIYYNLGLAGSGTKTMTGITTVSGDFTMAGSAATSGNVLTTIGGNLSLGDTSVLTTGANLAVTGTTAIGDGTTLILGAFTFTATGNITLGGGSTGIFTATNGTGVNFIGNLTINSGATFTKMISGTVTFKSGTGSQTWTNSGTPQDLGAVAISVNTTNTTLTLGSAVKATSLTINSSQTLNLSSFTLSLTATSSAPFVVNGTFTPSTGTVNYIPTSPSSSITIAPTTYHHVIFNRTGATFTLDGNLATDNGGNLTITAGTLDVSNADDWSISFGGNWVNTGTFNAQAGNVTFTGTGSQTLTSGGSLFSVFTQNGAGGTITLQDAFTATTGIDFIKGTFSANNFDVTAGQFGSDYSNTRTLNMGSGTWTLTGTANIWYSPTITGFTINPSTSTIVISNTSIVTKSFQAGGKTFNNLTITGSGTGAVAFTGANTFANFTIGAPKTVTFPASTTTTFTGTFTCTGTAGNVITINSSSATTQHILSKASGTVSCDYLSLRDSNAIGGAIWSPGIHTTNVSNNSGWLFDTTAPTVDAGADKSETAQFTQNATASDAGSGIASYLWTKQSGSGTITFGTATAEDTTISSDTAGTFVIRLTVTDVAGNSNYDEFTLTWTIVSSGGGGGGGSGTSSSSGEGRGCSSCNQSVFGKPNIINPPIQTPISPSPTKYIFMRYLGYGDTGEDVLELQKLLMRMELFTTVPIGIYGPQTRLAVKKLQKMYNISQIGVVGPLTKKLLNSL